MKKRNKSSMELSPFLLGLPLFPKGTFQKKGGRFLLEVFTSRPTTLTMESILEDGERREWKSGRGPKYPSGEILPSYIVGSVDTLVEKGEVKNIHAAFPEIANITGYGSADCIKKIYYTALKRDMYRNLIEWIDPNQPITNLENLIYSIKEAVGKGLIWEPQNLKEAMTRITEVYGEGEKRRIMLIYIEELEKLLTVQTDNETIVAAKKWWSGLREKALHLPSSHE